MYSAIGVDRTKLLLERLDILSRHRLQLWGLLDAHDGEVVRIFLPLPFAAAAAQIDLHTLVFDVGVHLGGVFHHQGAEFLFGLGGETEVGGEYDCEER